VRPLAALIPALALAVTVSACSSSSNGTGSAIKTTSSSTASTASTPATSSTSASTNGTALNAAQLKALLLTKNDVPAGWTASPSAGGTTATDAADQAKVAQCIGVPDPDTHKVAEADSDDYDLNNSSISSSATSYPSSSDVDAGVALLTSPKSTECYKQLFQDTIAKDLPAGTTVDSVSVKLTPGTNGGPSNVVAKADADLTVSAEGQTVKLVIDAWFVRGKQVGAEVDFFGFGQAIADSIQATALKAVADRVAAA
jgi:hypothetical protein